MCHHLHVLVSAYICPCYIIRFVLYECKNKRTTLPSTVKHSMLKSLPCTLNCAMLLSACTQYEGKEMPLTPCITKYNKTRTKIEFVCLIYNKRANQRKTEYKGYSQWKDKLDPHPSNLSWVMFSCTESSGVRFNNSSTETTEAFPLNAMWTSIPIVIWNLSIWKVLTNRGLNGQRGFYQLVHGGTFRILLCPQSPERWLQRTPHPEREWWRWQWHV